MKKDNTCVVLFQLIKKLKIKISETSLLAELEKHPDYPSLHALSDVLDNFHIPNFAYQIGFEDVLNISGPFIAHVKNPKTVQEFVMVSEVNGDQVIISNQNFKDKCINKETFRELFLGIVFVVQPGTIAEKGGSRFEGVKKLFLQNKNLIIALGFLAILIPLFSLHIFSLNSLYSPVALLIICKISGMIVSLLLLIQTFDSNNVFVQRLCQVSKTNCSAVLASDNARLLGAISWAELGCLYFVGTGLALLFNNGSLPMLLILRLFNFMTIPYVFYSFYTQYKILKNWCVLCCIVQLIFCLELVAFSYIPPGGWGLPALSGWVDLCSCFAFPVLIWMFIKPYFLRSVHFESLKTELRTFKYNSTLFNTTLTHQPQYKLLDENSSIILGNKDAKTTVSLVSSPYCEPCSVAHKSFDAWIMDREDIKFQIVFATGDDYQNHKTEVSRHLMSLTYENGFEYMRQALNDWYGQKKKDYKLWAKRYPYKSEHALSPVMEIQRKWCSMVEIESTPAIFINGYKLPDIFQPDDIKYLI